MSGGDQDIDELARLREKRMAEMMSEIEKRRSLGVVTIDEMNFRSFISENRFCVLDLWAEWCGPCRRLAPIFEELSSEFAGKVAFGRCNTDENQHLAASFSITAIPTVLFFSGGRMLNRVTGAYPKETLEKQIKNAFPLD